MQEAEVLRSVLNALGKPVEPAVVKLADITPDDVKRLVELIQSAHAAQEDPTTCSLALLFVRLTSLTGNSSHLGTSIDAAQEAAERLHTYPVLTEALLDIRREMLAELDLGTVKRLPVLRSLTLMIAARETQHGKFDSASQLVRELSDRCQRLGDRYGHFLCLVWLAENSCAQRDIHSILHYGLALSGACESLENEDDELRQKASSVLVLTAAHLYTSQDHANAKRLLEHCIRIWPRHSDGHHWLGNCELALGNIQTAISCFKSAVVLDPSRHGSHLSLSAAHLKLGELDLAIDAATTAINLAPADSRAYWNRAHAYMDKEQYAAAIDDWRKIAELSAGDSSTRPGADDARLNLIHCQLALGQTREAEEQIDWLIAHASSPDVKARLHQYRAERAAADYATAVDAYTQAIELTPKREDYRRERADLHLRHGAIDAALLDLNALMIERPSQATIEFLVDRLTRIVEEHPDNVAALTAIAFMHQRMGENRKAVGYLTKAIGLTPSDAELHYRCGVCKLAMDVTKEGMKNPPGRQGIIEASDHLARAVRLAKDRDDIVDAMKWLIDHTAADYRWFSFWINSPLRQFSGMNNIFALIPAWADPFVEIVTARELSAKNEWRAAVVRFELARTQLRQLGFNALANRLNIELADALCGLQEYERALDCLLEVAPSRWSRPLSANFQVYVRTTEPADAERPNPVEFEFAWIQTWNDARTLCESRVLEAAILHRSKQFDAAAAKLEPLDQLLTDLDTHFEIHEQIELKLKLVPVLRDTGYFERALLILDQFQNVRLPSQIKCHCLLTKATLFLEQADYWKALRCIKTALKLVDKSNVLMRAHLRIVAAEIYLRVDDVKHAAQTLPAEIDPAIEQYGDVGLKYRFVRAKLCFATGKVKEATRLLQAVLDDVEQIRSGLRSVEFRQNWQAQFIELYELAIYALASAGDTETAFELCERARARTFAEQLASAELPLPAGVQPLKDTLAKLQRRLSLLTRIERALAARTGGESPYELLVELAQLDPAARSFDLTGLEEHRSVAEAALQEMSARRETVEKRLVEIQRELDLQRGIARGKAAGPVMDYAQVRSLLADNASARRVVLVEYYVAKHQTLMFLCREDLSRPEVRVVDCGRDELEASVAHATVYRGWDGNDGAFHSGEFNLDQRLSGLTAPLFETTPTQAQFVVPGDLLWIVPHGPLHHVPFHALPVEGRPLIERNPVCYAPSASVMQICLERHAPRLETALVVGDARGAISERDIAIQTVPTRMLRRELTRAGAFVTNHGDESIFIAPSRETATLAALELKPAHSLKMDRKSESRLLCGELWALAKRGVQRVHIREEEMLVQARSEARNVAAMFHTQPLLDDAATKTSVKALLAQRHYDVIHFACHSEYDSRQPLQSSIWLAPDPLPRRDDTRPEHLSANECLELDLRAELVVISGCETGLGDTAIGDEVYGLPRALLSAGAASVLVSLWAIDDVPTMLLITRFYRELVEGDQSQPVVWRKAAALQAAQLYLRNLSVRETREYCHLCLTDLNCHQDAEQYERPFEELIDELADLPDDATPYADFHNWAPFVLVGCWN